MTQHAKAPRLPRDAGEAAGSPEMVLALVVLLVDLLVLLAG